MSNSANTVSKPSSSAFAWDDPLLLDEQLSEDERMIRDSAAAFAKSELLFQRLDQPADRALRQIELARSRRRGSIAQDRLEGREMADMGKKSSLAHL